MSYYGFDPNDWRNKLPKGVQFYDFGGGVYQAPMVEGDSYLTASLIALCEDPVNPEQMQILAFKVPHAAHINKNSDWGPLVDRMVDVWKSSKVEPTGHGARMPIFNL